MYRKNHNILQKVIKFKLRFWFNDSLTEKRNLLTQILNFQNIEKKPNKKQQKNDT